MFKTTEAIVFHQILSETFVVGYLCRVYCNCQMSGTAGLEKQSEASSVIEGKLHHLPHELLFTSPQSESALISITD